jgi:glycine/D-amino acid oxidase-like deaminating enzyme
MVKGTRAACGGLLPSRRGRAQTRKTRMYFELERVVKNAQYRWQKREERPEGPPRWKDSLGREFWAKEAVNRFAFIGHGSTVAYYLTALSQLSVSGAERKEDLYGAMLLFGITDPWQKEVRGSGFINHEVHQIGHWGAKVPEFSEDYMRREAFASQNAAAFQHAVKAGATAIAEEVLAVKQLGDVFEIQTTSASYFATLVIVAMGLGLSRDLGHAICPKPVPSLTPLNRSQFDGLVFTLDTFMQLYDETPGMRGNVEHRETPTSGLH